MKVFYLVSLFFYCCTMQVRAQEEPVSRKQFFTDTAVVNVTLQTDMKKLYAQKKNPVFQPGSITWHQYDSSFDLTAPIKVRLRGNNRRENCRAASLMVEFRDSASQSKLKNLKNLKLVAPCGRGLDNEQLVLKEYLVYKIYNEITGISFRVRLLNLGFRDLNNKPAQPAQYAFAIEPIDDVAKRNGCTEQDEKQFLTEQTNRAQTTLVSMFQYMIGNTDWSVPVYHNIKLIESKEPAGMPPYVVPYDFDYCGLVNAPYAVPHESTGLTSVTERLYMGFPRNMEEIRIAAAIFKAKRKTITRIINSFSLLTESNKTKMHLFLDEFYDLLDDEDRMKSVFIDNARKK